VNFKSLALAATTFIFYFLPIPLAAQTNPNFEMGYKPFGTYDESTFDSVSIVNSNLTLHIPLLVYPQRGPLTADTHLAYNGKNWMVTQTCFGSTCTDTWRWNPLSPQGVFFNSSGGANVAYAPVVVGKPLGNIFTAYTSDGATHMLYPDAAGGYHSVDGTGIWYNGATGSQTGKILMRDGTQPLLVDPNGNWASSYSGFQSNIISNYAAGVNTDTLGRILNQTRARLRLTTQDALHRPLRPKSVQRELDPTRGTTARTYR